MHAPKPTRRSLLAGVATTAFASSIRPALAAPKTIVWWYEGATADAAGGARQVSRRAVQRLAVRLQAGDRMARQRAARPAPGGAGRRPGPGHRADQRAVLDAALRQRQQAPATSTPFAQKFGWKEKLAPIVIQLGSYDGKLIALPKTIETQALFYNQTLFKQNAWTPPKDLAERGDVGRRDDEGRHPAVRRRQRRPALRQPAPARHLLQQLLLARVWSTRR